MSGPRTTNQSAAGRNVRERQTDHPPLRERTSTKDAKPVAAKSARTVKELMARIDQ